jgi:hypothetical protein
MLLFLFSKVRRVRLILVSPAVDCHGLRPVDPCVMVDHRTTEPLQRYVGPLQDALQVTGRRRCREENRAGSGWRDDDNDAQVRLCPHEGHLGCP